MRPIVPDPELSTGRAVTKHMTEMKTRFVGNCPVCERDQRLKDNRMVHHGYQRPGDGCIYGDCPGVKYLAYELSTEGCEYYKKMVQSQKAAVEAHLASLEAGEVKTLHKETYDGSSRFPKLVPVQEGEAGFLSLLRSAINKAHGRISQCEFEIERMNKRIAAWTLKAVRTLEEAAEAARTAPEKLARKAERDAKRQARADKAAALKAKRDAWKAERQALITKYHDLFTKLHNGLESVQDRKNCANMHWRDMNKASRKKGYLSFYPRELGCDEALIALGLARTENRGSGDFTMYAYDNGLLP